jgi:hypothetical protein
MLETLLQIGKTLRESGRLRHHRYIKRPQSDKKTIIVYFKVPVQEDFSFDLEQIQVITDEDVIKNDLFYLTYKSSDSDSDVKYMWGDILYGVIKGEEKGYYRMEKSGSKKASSFGRGTKDAAFFAGTLIEKFRVAFANQQEAIENFLKANSQEQLCFLHFDFQGNHWYQFDDELQAINNKLMDEFVARQNNQVVLRKSLYKTLASPEKNWPFPNFSAESIYKTKVFDSTDEVMDLLYAINYSTTPTITQNKIKIIVLPKGNDLQPDQIEEFFEQSRSEKKSKTKKAVTQVEKENKLSIELQQASFAALFDGLFPQSLFEVGDNIKSFDFIFSKKGGSVSSPDVDMIELASLEKSHLRKTGEEIAGIRLNVEEKRDQEIKSKKELFPLDVCRSFLNILGDVTTDKKKYQSHLLKVLPQIYSGTYCRDDLLLPVFLEKTEFNIRNENPNYNLLKYDYEFLTRLRKDGKTEMETMMNSPSYKVGKLLGQMAYPVSREINSFEKNYVGLLSRRIADKQGLIAFSNFINQKLMIHDVAYKNLRDKFIEITKILPEISETDYHRDYCAFGFFEGYFGKPDLPVKTDVITNPEPTNN